MPIYPRPNLPADAPRTRLLFIGNSLTYYNDLPGLLAQLSRGERAPIEFDYSAHPAWTLRRHWEWGSARERIASRAWDFVVLQDFSTMPIDRPARSLEYFQRFDELITRQGARTIIFENWTHQNRRQDSETMSAAYRTIQSRTGAMLAPVGQAFARARDKLPEINLLRDDRHPTSAGTYLAACVLYQAIYAKSCIGLPTDLPGMKLTPAAARQLQEIAAQVR